MYGIYIYMYRDVALKAALAIPLKGHPGPASCRQRRRAASGRARAKVQAAEGAKGSLLKYDVYIYIYVWYVYMVCVYIYGICI